MPDAIYVLCGGQTRDGGVPPWVEARAIAASSQWKKLKEASARPPAVVLLGAGSPHAPPVMNEWGHVKHEVSHFMHGAPARRGARIVV